MSQYTIELYSPVHRSRWVRMRSALYEEERLDHLEQEIEEITSSGMMNHQPYACLLAIDSEGVAVGFVELSLRSTAEECTSSPVAYVEGWYVEPGVRRQGVGRLLMDSACEWGKAKGCREIGSDTQHDNRRSFDAHTALGFEDAGLVQHFRRSL